LRFLAGQRNAEVSRFSMPTHKPKIKRFRHAGGATVKIFLVPSDRQIAAAPVPPCGHLDLDPIRMPQCEECWILNRYLGDVFKLDSWDYPDEWRRAWKRVVEKDLPQKVTVTTEERRIQQRTAQKRWRIKNWEKDLARQLTRRAAIEEATDEERAQIEMWFQWKRLPSVICHWCRQTFTPKRCHADHVIPLSRGGKHQLSNLVIACATCNLRKNAQMPEVWAARLRSAA
jgi:5-methylcytosine-specific restriction endonuclease McrA